MKCCGKPGEKLSYYSFFYSSIFSIQYSYFNTPVLSYDGLICIALDVTCVTQRWAVLTPESESEPELGPNFINLKLESESESYGQGSGWVTVSLSPLLLAGGLTSTSSCVFSDSA